MKRVVLGLILSFFVAIAAQAQSTTVSGQVTDAGAQSWNNGTVTAQFVPNPLYPTLPQYAWTGGALSQSINGALNGTGGYSISIPSNTAITPVGSTWKFQFCPLASSPCFTTANVTITGATQTVNATPPAIVVSSGPGVTAYADGEITGAVIGSMYYNTTTNVQRVCNGPNPCTWGANGGTTASVSALTTKVIYATDPTYAGGVKATTHLFIGSLNTTGLITSLKEMDNSTAYNPIASGAKVGDYVACVDQFGKSSAQSLVDLGDGTISSLSATQIQSSNGSSTSNATVNCWTGPDDTNALVAAFAAAQTFPCFQLVLPAGRILMSKNPFINTPAITQGCAVKIKGQGSSINSGGVCCQLTRDYGTTLVPTVGFPLSGGGNTCQNVLLCDTSGSNGELSNFVLDALGLPFTGQPASNGLGPAKNYMHDVAVFGYFPTNGCPCPAFLLNGTGATYSNIAAQGVETAAAVNASNITINNAQFGNNNHNWIFTNAFDVLISGGFEDETSSLEMQLVNSTNVRFANVTMLGSPTTCATVDGTSTLWLDQVALCTEAVAASQALVISSGGKVTASQTWLGTGNSTTNASVSNSGTFINNGAIICATATLTANNSGGNIPGGCIANGGNQAIPSLTLGTVNWQILSDTVQTWAQWTPPTLADGVGVNVTRVEVVSSNTPACTVAPNLRLSNGTTTMNVPLSLSSNITNSGVGANLFVKGTAITVSISAAGTCTTAPANLAVNADWQEVM
jgi:hypothetical protein